MLRIIGGMLRGQLLTLPPASLTRPTSDRGRESIFNILTHRFNSQNGTSLLKNAKVLDLFAGSGAFGLECLSRGADFCVFVENHPTVFSLLNKNRTKLNLLEKSCILNIDIGKSLILPKPYSQIVFDLIFLDPPYSSGYIYKTLKSCVQRGYLGSKTLFVAELRTNENISDIQESFTILEHRIYGCAQFLFGKQNSMEPHASKNLHLDL